LALEPNPSNNQFDIAIFGAIAANSQIEILDMQGNVVFSAPATAGKTSVSVKDWSNGVYLVRFIENGQITQKKFIKN
jgi:hypothetical protein